MFYNLVTVFNKKSLLWEQNRMDTRSSFQPFNKVFSPLFVTLDLRSRGESHCTSQGSCEKKRLPWQRVSACYIQKQNLHAPHEATRWNTASINLICHKTVKQHSGRHGPNCQLVTTFVERWKIPTIGRPNPFISTSNTAQVNKDWKAENWTWGVPFFFFYRYRSVETLLYRFGIYLKENVDNGACGEDRYTKIEPHLSCISVLFRLKPSPF